MAHWHTSTYDLVTTAAWSGSGGTLGLASTPLAHHGGRFTRGSVTLTSALSLAYYTRLSVNGDLDAAGHSIHLDSFSTLEVSGSIRNVAVLDVGAFVYLNVHGNVSATTAGWIGGGSCAPPACDPDGLPFPIPQRRYGTEYNASRIQVNGSLSVENLRFHNASSTGWAVTSCCTIVTVGSDVHVTGAEPVDLSSLHQLNTTGSFNAAGDVTVSEAGTVLRGTKSVSVGGTLFNRNEGYVSTQGTLSTGNFTFYFGMLYGVLDVTSLVVSETLSLSRCFDWTFTGQATVGSLTLYNSGRVTFGPLTITTKNCPPPGPYVPAYNVHCGLQMDASSSISAESVDGGDLIIGYGARLSTHYLTASTLYITSGATVDVVAMSTVQTLHMDAAARLSLEHFAMTVQRRVEAAPHIQLQCPHGTSWHAAGTGTLGHVPTAAENASATCPWPYRAPYVTPWGSHLPASSCRIARNLCGPDHSGDYSASWLQHGLLGADASAFGEP
jgi:hypothetical protein